MLEKNSWFSRDSNRTKRVDVEIVVFTGNFAFCSALVTRTACASRSSDLHVLQLGGHQEGDDRGR